LDAENQGGVLISAERDRGSGGLSKAKHERARAQTVHGLANDSTVLERNASRRGAAGPVQSDGRLIFNSAPLGQSADDCVPPAGQADVGGANVVASLDEVAGGIAAGAPLADDEVSTDALFVDVPDHEVPDDPRLVDPPLDLVSDDAAVAELSIDDVAGARVGATPPALAVLAGAGAGALSDEVVLVDARDAATRGVMVLDCADIVRVGEAVKRARGE